MPEASTPVSESPFSFQQQVYDHGGQRWRIEVTYPPMDSATFRQLRGFLLSLHGTVGTFRAGDPFDIAPTGIATGTPVVDLASQTGYTLNTRGWSVSTTNILKAGDNFQIGDYLYTNLKDVNSDGSGKCTLDIWPSLRISPADGATIITALPKSLFRLDRVDIGFSTGIDKVYNVAFSGVEALP